VARTAPGSPSSKASVHVCTCGGGMCVYVVVVVCVRVGVYVMRCDVM